MKKPIIITFVFLFLCNFIFSQDSLRKNKIGLSFHYSRAFKDRDIVLPGITFSRGKNVLVAGPAVFYLRSPFYFFSTRSLYGGHIGLQHFPNGNRRRLNLYFEYDLNVMSGEVENIHGAQYWPSRERLEMKIKKTDISNFLSFGFRLKILKFFYLNINSGVSIFSLYKDEYTYRYPDGQRFTAKGRMAFRPISYMSGYFKMGLGLDLFRFK